MSDYDDAFGPWLDVVRVGATLGLSLAGLPAAGEGVSLVFALIGIEEAQARLLRGIKNDTRLLREGDFAAAKLMLREASRVGSSDPRYPTFLQKSADLLYKAHGLAESVQEQSIVEFQLAVVWYALQSEGDGKYWIEQSASTADRVLEQMVGSMQELPARLALRLIDDRQEAESQGEGESESESTSSTSPPAKWVAPAVVAYAALNPVLGLAGVGAAVSFYKVQRARLSRLREYLPFYNSVATMNARAHLQEPPAPLVIISLAETEIDSVIEDVAQGQGAFSLRIPGYSGRKFMLTRIGRQSPGHMLKP
jgi:hypothetical protein